MRPRLPGGHVSPKLEGDGGFLGGSFELARTLETEYQKQNLRHCCDGELPPIVSMSSTGREVPSPWFIRIILSSIFLASPSPIAWRKTFPQRCFVRRSVSGRPLASTLCRGGLFGRGRRDSDGRPSGRSLAGRGAGPAFSPSARRSDSSRPREVGGRHRADRAP